MKNHRLVIIGAGPAGLGASLYAGRAMIDTLVIEKLAPGGQVLITDWVDNYLGFPDGIAGYDLIEAMKKHAGKFNYHEINGEVASIEEGEGQMKKIKLSSGEEIHTETIIIATGARHKRLGVAGEEALTGKGVSYCATCDGPFYRDQEIAVVGGGDSAVKEALFLTNFAKKIYLIHRRDELRAVKYLQDKLLSNSKIEPVLNTVVDEISGDDTVRSVLLRNVKTDVKKSLDVSGVFIFVGIHPDTDFTGELIDKDKSGFILTDDWMKTSKPGIFAAGDCRARPLHQIITAVADGATAAYAVEHYLSTK